MGKLAISEMVLFDEPSNKQRALLYASPPIQKLHPCSDIISNYTSLPFMAAIFLVTYLKIVLQLSGYSIFHGGDTPIWLGLP